MIRVYIIEKSIFLSLKMKSDSENEKRKKNEAEQNDHRHDQGSKITTLIMGFLQVYATSFFFFF